MKKNIKFIAIGLLMLAGLSLLLYPLVSNTWNNYRQTQLISSYEEAIVVADENGQIDYESEVLMANTYNTNLLPCILPDSFATAEAAEEEDEEYMSCLNLNGDGIMGYVQIPKIGIKLPIFHGTSDEVLQIGAGHLEGSSLPIGGESTHSVLSAHRGLPSASLFTDLDLMKEGDHFYINVLDETLAYEVDQILTVEPEDTTALAVEDGKDLVTLLTCTPYGVNTQRLLVRGHRVDYVEGMVEEEDIPLAAYSYHTNYLLWVLVGLGITAAFILVLFILDRHLSKKSTKA
ncbi:MAG: class C sortase [Lachnospiraceae bacterium]